jgi:hypothetical protein
LRRRIGSRGGKPCDGELLAMPRKLWNRHALKFGLNARVLVMRDDRGAR